MGWGADDCVPGVDGAQVIVRCGARGARAVAGAGDGVEDFGGGGRVVERGAGCAAGATGAAGTGLALCFVVVGAFGVSRHYDGAAGRIGHVAENVVEPARGRCGVEHGHHVVWDLQDLVLLVQVLDYRDIDHGCGVPEEGITEGDGTEVDGKGWGVLQYGLSEIGNLDHSISKVILKFS